MTLLKLSQRSTPIRSGSTKTSANTKGAGRVIDFYQDSIEKIGRDQFKKLIEKGLSIPVFVL